MTENDLRKIIGSWDSLALVIDHLSEYPEHINALMNISMDDELEGSWRASWLISKIYETYPEQLEPWLE